MDNTIIQFFKTIFHKNTIYDDILKSGTGFMVNMTDVVHKLQNQGYTENLVPHFDRLECRGGQVKLYPQDFYVDKVVRFENSSDPDDQSILYAISSVSFAIKGLYIDSYGSYHDELSSSMMEYFKTQSHRLN